MYDTIGICLLFEAILFLSTGLSKAIHWRRHVQSVKEYVPKPLGLLTGFVSTFTLVLDWAVFVSYIILPNTKIESVLALGMISIYSVALIIRIKGARNVESFCACGGFAGDYKLSYLLLVRNLLLAVPAIVVCVPSVTMTARPWFSVNHELSTVLNLIEAASLLVIVNVVSSSIEAIKDIRGYRPSI